MSDTMFGTWSVIPDPEADVRLRSERVGPFSVTVTAPVRAGSMTVDGHTIRLHLELELDRLSTSNFMVQRTARGIIEKYDGQLLQYDATGTGGTPPWSVSGVARSGTVELDMDLVVTPAGPDNDPMGVIEVGGSASIPDVDMPVIGRLDQLTFTIDARLGLASA